MARLLRHARFLTVLLTTALIVAACSSAARSATRARAADCTIGPAPATLADSATIVVTSPIDLTDPTRGTTWGEAFLLGLTSDSAGAPVLDCERRPLTTKAGPYRLQRVNQSTITLTPLDPTRSPRLTIREATDATARDLIDAGADLLLTEAPTIAAYAASRPDAMIVRLGWHRTWLIATRVPGGLGLDSTSTLRADLARDVVPADARPAAGTAWWLGAGCTSATAPTVSSPPPTTSSRIVYQRNEPVARALAERLVALVGGGAIAASLPPNAFVSALRSGTELAYVFPVEARPAIPCEAAAQLGVTVPWLESLPGHREALTALIDTRLLAVVRRDRLRLTMTADSSITVSGRQP